MNEMKGRNPLPGASPTLRDRQQGVFYMLHLKEEVQQATAFDEPVVGHWLEGEKAQNQGQVNVHAWAIPPPVYQGRKKPTVHSIPFSLQHTARGLLHAALLKRRYNKIRCLMNQTNALVFSKTRHHSGERILL